MTYSQEEALYDFLDKTDRAFTLDEAVAYLRAADSARVRRLPDETAALLDTRRLAFPLGGRRWLTRRGCFEPATFLIRPTRLELQNGILIPGHRCAPFVHPELMPHELSFFWEGGAIPTDTTEGEPDDFYPFYNLYGEEYAPQYVAKDNPRNEEAFNADPYEDPPEVSIHTLDMRAIYRAAGFVPGDGFVARVLEWHSGAFTLEKVGKDDWPESAVDEWRQAMEQGFEETFRTIGPGGSTEEQMAFACWFGGERARTVPALALEEFLYEKTDRVETVVYGIESRFWYAGKEIPDARGLEGISRPDRTPIETLLWRLRVPVTEYVVQSYIRDLIYRREDTLAPLISRIVPPGIRLDRRERRALIEYIREVLEEYQDTYSPFKDAAMAPLRQRVAELHTAVIELAVRIEDMDRAWLPPHTFITLSQIQIHAAAALEELDVDDAPEDTELQAMDSALDSMLETYEDIRAQINESMENFRRSRLSLVLTPPAADAKAGGKTGGKAGGKADGDRADGDQAGGDPIPWPAAPSPSGCCNAASAAPTSGAASSSPKTVTSTPSTGSS